MQVYCYGDGQQCMLLNLIFQPGSELRLSQASEQVFRARTRRGSESFQILHELQTSARFRNMQLVMFKSYGTLLERVDLRLAEGGSVSLQLALESHAHLVLLARHRLLTDHRRCWHEEREL